MPFDAPVVAGLAQEIQRFLPVKIARIYQPYPDEFHFSCYGGGETFALLISLNPQYARFHLIPDKRDDSTVVSSFCLLLRKYFSGSRLTTIQALPFERLIKLTFEIYDPISGLNLKHIWVEFTGRSANLIVCEADNVIIDVWRRRESKRPEDRDLTIGATYQLPPTKGRWQPVTIDLATFITLMQQLPNEVTLGKFLQQQWLGLSVQAITEICQRASLGPDQFCREINLPAIEALYYAFQDWAGPLSRGEFCPTGIYDATGKIQDFLAFTPQQLPADCYAKSLDSLNKIVATCLGIQHQAIRFNEAKEQLLRKIKNHADKNQRKLEKQLAEAAQAEKSESLRICGELLTIYGFQISKGATCANLPNHYDPDNQRISIKLDSALNAHDNAQNYFKKYQKAKKGQQSIALQIAKTQAVTDYFDSLEAMAETAENQEDLELIQQELAEKPRQTKKRTKPGSKGSKTSPESKPRQFQTATGHTILVGRNNLQNDRLTFKTASPNDWWFHTQKIPGSHVILKLLPGMEADEEALYYACQLAVYYSKARASTKVSVDYTQRKHVKKPQGAKAGFVIYDNFKTVIITPEEAVLKKLGVVD